MTDRKVTPVSRPTLWYTPPGYQPLQNGERLIFWKENPPEIGSKFKVIGVNKVNFTIQQAGQFVGQIGEVVEIRGYLGVLMKFPNGNLCEVPYEMLEGNQRL